MTSGSGTDQNEPNPRWKRGGSPDLVSGAAGGGRSPWVGVGAAGRSRRTTRRWRGGGGRVGDWQGASEIGGGTTAALRCCGVGGRRRVAVGGTVEGLESDWGGEKKLAGRWGKNCLRKGAATEIIPNRNSGSGQTVLHATGIDLVVACNLPHPLRVLPCPELVRAPLTGRVRWIPARCHSVDTGRVCFIRPLPLLAVACGFRCPLRLCAPL